MIPIELLELKHNLVDRDWDYCPDYKMDKNEADKVVKAIDGLKSDKPVGEWLVSDNDNTGMTTFTCSVCGVKYSHKIGHYVVASLYCPRCGADMRGEEE